MNVTQLQFPAGNVHGLEYFVPKPALHGYTETNGLVICATAISAPLGENATYNQVLAGKVPGFEYFVQKPELRG